MLCVFVCFHSAYLYCSRKDAQTDFLRCEPFLRASNNDKTFIRTVVFSELSYIEICILMYLFLFLIGQET